MKQNLISPILPPAMPNVLRQAPRERRISMVHPFTLSLSKGESNSERLDIIRKQKGGAREKEGHFLMNLQKIQKLPFS